MKQNHVSFFEKNGYHSISIYENCSITSNFLMVTSKNFLSKIEFDQIFFCFFFNRKSNLALKQTFSKKNLRAKIYFLSA